MEKMQFGTPDEGAAAFRSAVQQLMQSHAPQADPSETVMVRLEDRKAMDEIRRYAEANPDVADPVMQQIIGPISSRLMAEDLMQHIPFEELRVRVRNFDDLKNLHVRARAANAEGIHSAAQILAEAHQRAKDWRSGREPRQGYVPPQPGQDTRSQRKEALTTQPAMRRQAPTLPNQQQRSQEQSRSDAVMKMRAARGQAV
jgi:hypothetical protein